MAIIMCEKGPYFDNSKFFQCPYCGIAFDFGQNEFKNNLDQTMLLLADEEDDDRTILLWEAGEDDDKTIFLLEDDNNDDRTILVFEDGEANH